MHWQRRFLSYLILFLLLMGLLSGCSQSRRIKVLSNSMEPTLKVNAVYTVESIKPEELQHGDVIIFKRNDEENVKRLIGLPGDTVEMRSGKVYLNGEQLNEEYIQNPGSSTYTEKKLGEDEYFVLGDNREMSADSHIYGPIKGEDITGKVVLEE